MDFKQKIIEMIETIKNEWLLEQIYMCIMNILK